MIEIDIKKNRSWSYNILINEFEPTLRKVLIEKILLPNFGATGWKNYIPQNIFEYLNKEINQNDIYSFFDELYLLSLKEIVMNKSVFPLCRNTLFNDMSKDIFDSLFNELNETRRKIAHAKATFSNYDFEVMIENLKKLCNKDNFSVFLNYIDTEQYKNTDVIPQSFMIEEKCFNNLPSEDYALDGGFIGRKKEVQDIKKLLYSDLDRIISITGAGGLGKTALALNTVHNICLDESNPYSYIVWFSAKENKLTAEEGIVNLDSQISDYSTLLYDIADELMLEYDEEYEDFDLKSEIYMHLKNNKCLLIIDNLETISDSNIIQFIKDVPRPSQVLITSRKGLGEIERRYPLPEFPVSDAIILFRILAKEKNKNDLLHLKDVSIKQLVTSVKCYPLLIKWSIGKTCLGMDINKAFNEIYSGNSEISQFVFNDIFAMFSKNQKYILYAMIVHGSKPISLEMLKHFVNFDDEEFEDCIQNLIMCSFIYSEILDANNRPITQYNMLALTRGFIQTKLDSEDPSLRLKLQDVQHKLQLNAEETERVFSEYNRSLKAFGLKTDEDKLAYNYIKTAKNYLKQNQYDMASKHFDKALSIAPDLIYAINEVAKFESKMGHIDKAEELFKNGIAINKNSLILASYGIFLRKNNRTADAVSILKLALEVDSENATVLTELGRAYSFNSQFEDANNQYAKALSVARIDFKQKRVAMYFQADNYHRWGEMYFLKKENYLAFIEYCNKAIELTDACLEMNSFDEQVKKLQSKIYKDIGITYLKLTNIKSAEQAFNKVIALNVFKNKCIIVRELCKFYLKTNENLNAVISPWIKAVEKYCITPQEKDGFDRLSEYVNQKNNRLTGKIRFINMKNRYGVIDYNANDSCSFIFKNTRFYIDRSNASLFEGKDVSFELTIKNGKAIAVNVDFI